jgi:cell filamentation protein, protein adenylyltransferase
VARGRPKRDDVLARFDRSLNDLWAVGGLPLPVEAEAIWEGIWHEETHHSTAMEGNTLVLRQVKALLAEGRAVGNKELREYLEIEGYGDAAKWVYQNALRRRLSDDNPSVIGLQEIRQIHELVMKPVWDRIPDQGAKVSEGPGGFRECEIMPLRPGLKVSPQSDIRPRLDDWIDRANQASGDDVHVLSQLALLHAAFERIHPFRDGNGRVGRLVLNLLLVRRGAPPAIIDKKARPTYLRGLKAADEGDPGLLSEVLARAVCKSVEKHMLPALAGPLRLVPLGALETQELSRVALLSAAKRRRLQAVKLGEHYYSTQRWVRDYASSRHQGRRAVA